MNVNLVTVKSTKSNVIHNSLFWVQIVEHREVLVIPVLMILGLIIKNATVRIIMNGVPRKRNAFVPLLSNIPAPVRGIREEMEILVITNMQNANARAVLHGMLHKGLVFVPALISAR